MGTLAVIEDDMGGTREGRGDALARGRWDDARVLFSETAPPDEHPDRLTVPAHEPMP